MAKGSIPDPVYSGSKTQSNPYAGDIKKAIDYDRYEAEFKKIVWGEGSFPTVLSAYRASARSLVNRLGNISLSSYDVVVDAGSGTGISTLEILSSLKPKDVKAIELSEGMLMLAKYKFNQLDYSSLENHPVSKSLSDYWTEFRSDSLPFKKSAHFIQGDIQNMESLLDGTVKAIVASHSLHWTNLEKSFQEFARVLKNNGIVVWNTSSHFYNDSRFPAKEWGFRENVFLRYVLDEVSKSVEIDDFFTLPRPKHTFDSIYQISEKAGLKLEQVATDVEPVDLQIFVKNHVPAITRQLIGNRLTPEETDRIIKSAIAVMINNADALADTNHKYEITPTFIMAKK